MKKSGILIHQIVSQSEDVRDEMEMFSLQLANENVEFNAAGFFTIDYTLIFTVNLINFRIIIHIKKFLLLFFLF